MTDQTIPADLTREEAQAVREWAELALAAWAPDKPVAKAARVVLAALPSPPRPTLAEMTPEERAACRWMQCDVEDRGGRYVIANPCDDDDDTGLVSVYGGIEWMSPERVTPRPDLPRLEWPGDQEPEDAPALPVARLPKKPAPAPAPALPAGWRLADHQTRGPVIVTRPETDNDGEVVVLCPDPDMVTRAALVWCKNDKLTYIDTEPEADTADTVPDHLAVGTVIKSADDPRIDALPVGSILLDRYEDATIKWRGDWTGAGYIPIPSDGDKLGPWKVLHIPKEEA